MLANGIPLVISRRDTLRSLGIKLCPSQIVYMTLNTVHGVVLDC